MPFSKFYLLLHNKPSPSFGLNPTAGVQPQWIQGLRSGDGVGEEKLVYLIRNIKRLRGNSIVGNFSGEKRLNNLVYVEVNKVSDKELAPSTLGHRCPLE